MTVSKVVVLRHGETEGNKAFEASLSQGDNQHMLRLQAESIGNPDNTRLTKLGIRQARKVEPSLRRLIEEIRNNEPVHYYCSPRIRAQYTAQLALPEVNWVYDDRLPERYWAVIEGYHPSIPPVEYINGCITRSKTIDLPPAPGGQSARQKYAEVMSFFRYAFNELSSGTLVICGHGDLMRLIRIYLLGLGIENWPTVSRTPVLNCQIEAYSIGHPDQPSHMVVNDRFDHHRIIYPPNNNRNLVSTGWITAKR